METFLASVAKDISSKNYDFLELIFVVPGKRAGAFLQKELLTISTKTTFAPKIISIEDFVQELSNVTLASNLQLLFEFYETYKELTKSDALEDFSSFSKWGQILLQDFNEIDRYLIPQNDIFSYLFSIKDLDHWSKQENKTEIQDNYLKFWKELNNYYSHFIQRLLDKKIGYQGLIYREAIENIEFYLQNNNNHHVFVGFNALNNAEERIIQEFLHNDLASIYWDIDELFLNDSEHDAGLFMRRYKKSWKIFNKIPFKNITNIYSSNKNIQIIGVPKNVGQAKYTGHILKNIMPNYLESTAVILANESLLNPVLNSIPDGIDKVNITCGFKLSDTPLASFILSFFDLLQPQKPNVWYYKNVINLFSQPITKIIFKHNEIDYSKKIIVHIQQKNTVQVTLNSIVQLLPQELINITKLIFTDKEHLTISDVIEHVISIILYTKDKINNDLDLEYLFRFYEVFNQIKLFNDTYKSITDISSLKEIYNELLTKETIDFKGEPLEGLQIMGVLESRNLDYETVIITSVNENILPAGKSNSSFIPFDAKLAYGLPTHKEKDAVYAYHFYRLLQRAKNIYLLYNTEPDVLEGGEKSRFIRQILYQNLPNHTIKEFIASPEVYFESNPIQEVNKNAKLIEKLKEVAGKGFSPSSLSNYIRNPIDFYKQTILGIRDVDEVEETVASNTLGTIVHDTLMDFYQPLEGKYLTLDSLEGMKKKISETITGHFEKVYKGGDFSTGKNLISYHIAKRYIENFLRFEISRLKEGRQIKILKIESDLKIKIEIPELDFPVYVRGKVDRVEEIDGILNIIDYKTGKVDQKDVEIVNWEDITADYKYSKAFQILCYAFMIKREFPSLSNQIEAGIISFKNLQNGLLKFSKKDKSGNGAIKENFINEKTFTHYTTELKKLILEICNLNIPFIEKEIETHYRA